MTKILIVDDSRVMLSVVQTYLAGLDASLELANNAEEALVSIDRQPPDVLVTDVNMPGTDGITLAREVKARTAGRTAVILISAAAIEEAERAVAAGAVDAFFPKPLDGEEFRLAVIKHLKRGLSLFPPTKALRLLAVDDTNVGKKLLERVLGSDQELELVDVVRDGKAALDVLPGAGIELVIADALCPGLNVHELAKQALVMGSQVAIIADESSPRSAAAAFRALEVGAIDLLPKLSLSDPQALSRFRRRLKTLGAASTTSEPERFPRPTPRSLATRAPELLVVGGGTGAPGVVSRLLAKTHATPTDTQVVVVLRHFEPFAQAYAKWLRELGINARLASQSTPLVPGRVVLAPDDCHLELESRTALRLVSGHADLCPSIDQLFSSAAEHYGPGCTGVLLSGMGQDGAEGLAAIHDAGGTTIAQGPDSCAAGAMPASALRIGAVDRMMAPTTLIRELERVLGAGSPSEQR